MNILVVSYLEGITNQIKEVINKKHENANIYEAIDTFSANCEIRRFDIDSIVIDMMVQQDVEVISKPILESALIFVRQVKKYFPDVKVFCLFDEDETEKRGQDKVKDLGYEFAAYDYFSEEWRDKLLKYI